MNKHFYLTCFSKRKRYSIFQSLENSQTIHSCFFITELTNGNSITTHICSGRQQFLACPSGNYISIIEAIYGRHNTWICPTSSYTLPYNQFFYWCNIGVKDKVMEMCEDKESCNIIVNTASFLSGPDPCPYADKYIKVIYSCSCKSF